MSSRGWEPDADAVDTEYLELHLIREQMCNDVAASPQNCYTSGEQFLVPQLRFGAKQ